MTTTTTATSEGLVPAGVDQRPAVLELPAAPGLPEADGPVAAAVTAAVPLLGAVGSVAVVVSTGHGSAQGWVMAAGILLASLAFAGATLCRTRSVRTARLRRSRRAHASRLAEARRTTAIAARTQRALAVAAHPDPADLPGLLPLLPGPPTSAGIPGALALRYGVAPSPLEVELRIGPTPPEQDPDPVVVRTLERFVDAHGTVGALPAVVDLAPGSVLRVRGPRETAQDLVRAMGAGALAGHDPRDLAVVLLTPPGRRPGWEWLAWAAHTRVVLEHGADPAHLVADGPGELGAVVGAAVDPRSGRRPGARVLVVADTDVDAAVVGALAARAVPGALVLAVEDAATSTTPPAPGRPGEAVLDLGTGGGRRTPASRHVVLHRAGADPVVAEADRLDVVGAAAVARRLPEVRPGTERADGGDALLALLHLHGPGPAAGAPGATGLRVELGRSVDGSTVVLDLEEAAHGGHGPHGLVVGATGSGKSELLRTLVLGLATGHGPEDLNLLLVDFKGGATFAGLAGLPHVSAVITNLADDLGLVDRMRDALEGELQRRQELLSAAGGFASRHDYESARREGRHEHPPLPRLLVVVDEFSELLTARPELVDLLAAVGRLGRSLGLHLLLASQRLEEGRLRGLDSHLSYRVALRTFSAAESRSVIGVPDAHGLPPRPGVGLLRTGPDEPVRFTTTYVSGPAAAVPGLRADRPHDPSPSAASDAVPRDRPLVTELRLRPLDVAAHGADGSGTATVAAEQRGPTVLEAVVDRLRDQGPRARSIWLPPLDRSPDLTSLLPDLGVHPAHGLTSPTWRDRGRLTFPLGLVDRPRQQRYDVLAADLSGDAGHAAVVGGPRSGRSTTLRTMLCAMALTRTPHEVRVLALDFGGGTLSSLAGLPHVSAVAGRAQPGLVRRVVAEVRATADAREARAALGGHPAPTGSTDDGDGDVGDVGGEPDVVLVVDQWSALRSDFPELEPELVDLAQRGLSHGVHLVVSANRWADLRPALRDVIGTRVELRLGDPLDSEVDRRLAAQVPTGRPGRALVVGGHHAVVAVPDVPALVTAVADAWTGPVAPPVRLLPASVRLDEVRSPDAPDPRLLLGLDAEHLAPVGVELADDPHLLVLGESRSGRTSALRTLLHDVRRRHTPDELQVFLVDPRCSLLGELDERWCADRAASAGEATRLVDELVAALTPRLPGPSVTPEQLRQRAWWQGPSALLVVDDADLLVGPAGSALGGLLPLLPHGRDVGLHVVLARRSAGLTRRPDPVVTALRDLDQPVLQLAGDPADVPYPVLARTVSGRPGHGHLVSRSGSVELQVARAG